MSIQDTVRRQMVGYIVRRNIFCPVSGRVLDERTCKWFVDADGDPAYVVDPLVYDIVSKNEETMAEMERRGYFPMP